MGFPTKVRLIKRKSREQWYIDFPSAIAQAMEFSRGETVEWLIENKALPALRRLEAPPTVLKNSAAGILPHFEQLWEECIPASTGGAAPTARKPSR